MSIENIINEAWENKDQVNQSSPQELKNSIEDGLKRKPDWKALKKIQEWLSL